MNTVKTKRQIMIEKSFGYTDNAEANKLRLDRSKLQTKALKVRLPGNAIQKELIRQIDELTAQIKELESK